ncbi:MAG: alpha/beta hydrolase family protein, partial [Candidatus Tectomicrobia bacterium]|nr:alpha/beta hydrolase family protein [Candidatus Tectomicrobia bacterium]
MSRAVSPPVKPRRFRHRIRVVWVVGLVLWTGLSMAAGIWIYQAKWHVKVSRLLDERNRQLGPLQSRGTILEFDRHLLETLEPEHRFQATTRQEWQTWRTDLTARLAQLLKLERLPRDFAPSAQVVEHVELEGVKREKIWLTTEPGLHIPLYLFIPLDAAPPHPAVIVFHGHGLGKRETAGELHTYQNRAALEVAKAGFVTVAPDNRGFGELGWSGRSYDVIHHKDIIINLMMGRTALGAFLHDAQKLVDYLQTRPEVDATRIATAGCSLGGVLAVWSAALDSRIQAVVSSATFGSPSRQGMASRLLHVSEEMLDHYHKLPVYTEFHVPGLFQYANATDVAGLIAPRPMLFDIDAGDKPSYPDVMAAIGKVYGLVGASDRLDIFLHDNGHTFSVEA